MYILCFLVGYNVNSNFYLSKAAVIALCGQADICQLGMDQRKVNVLAREYCDDIKRKNKQIILSHRIVLLQYLFWFLRSIECGEKLFQI